MHHRLEEMALIGALALGAYELYHLERYGNFGFGNPNNNNIGGYNDYGGYGGNSIPYGFGGPTFGHHHRHHHHLF